MIVFRRFLLVLLVFALPLQGIASITMLHCPPSGAAHGIFATDAHSADEARSAHEAPSAHSHSDHLAHTASLSDSAHAHSPGGVDDQQYGDKVDCCAATVALTASPAIGLPAASGAGRVLFDVGMLPTVYLDGLRRPPRTFLT